MEVKLENLKDQPMELQLETRNWRNSKQVADYFQIKEIPLEGHKKWLASLNNENPRTIAFLIKVEDKPLGVTYFHSIDRENKVTDWGIYIYDTSMRGQGIGKKTLSKCIEYARDKMGMDKIKLEVKKDNLHAISVYESCGFKYVEDKDDLFAKYDLELK